MDSRQKRIIVFGIHFWTISAAGFRLKYPGDECSDFSNRNGACSPLKECLIIQQELVTGIIPTSCGFWRGRPMVCCPGIEPSTTTTPSPEIASVEDKPGDRAKHWCKEYSKNCPKYNANTGKKTGLPHIFAHMVAVGYGPRNNIHWKCGGSLISDKFVLTTAQCLEDNKYGPVKWVLLGTQMFPPEEGKSWDKRGQIHEVTRKIAHPGYRPPAKYDDIGLIEIGSSISNHSLSLVGKDLHPACLRPNADVGYIYNIMSRWSGIGFGQNPKLELLRVAVDVFEEAKCNETFGYEIAANGRLPKGFDSKTLCAGMLKDGKDICQGDFGGPLQFPVHGECQHEVIGVISFGTDCLFPRSPSVYMRVSSYIEWIEDNVWPEKI